ncbi:MAG: glycoside hydrolase, partial [bacterium]
MSTGPKQDPFEFRTAKYLEWYRDEPMVRRNGFIGKAVNVAELPGFQQVKANLPNPHWPKNPLAIQAYWKAWELGLRNTHKVEKDSKFIENYIDAAFNGCIFLWDSVFILQFGRYGRRAFDYQKTLDNFYACQHKDGFICREIRADGTDQWTRYDPASTGPQLFAWSEWEHYLQVKDTDRLRAVFPALAGYHDWMKLQRSWPDGSYWSTGLGCGMDNLHRLPASADQERDHGWMSWVDATYQALLDARSIIKIAEVLGEDATSFKQEAEALSQ